MSQQSELDLIPECLIRLDWGDCQAHAIVVEKESQTISIYEGKGDFALKHRFACSTGEVFGKKEESGDRKTPEGIYFFTKAFKKNELSVTYGNRAFVMDYPNLLDQRQGRDGDNIWLHGTNKPLKPRDSNGCVVVENGAIDLLAQYIRLNQTPIIIKKKLHMVSAEQHVVRQESLIQFLEDWKDAFSTGDRAKYYACFDESSQGARRLWAAWDPIRTAWQDAELPFDVRFRNVTIATANPYVVALVAQVLHLDHHTINVGTKKIFMKPDGRTWKIVGEAQQPADSSLQGTRPMVTALTRLDQLQKNYKTVAEVIAEWAEAWSSENIERYRACYANDFRARGMDLDAWISYKDKLNNRYDSIRVSVEDIKANKQSDRCTVTFLQRYHSSGHQSVGVKRLRLKRVDGLWKIYRETWHKTQQ